MSKYMDTLDGVTTYFEHDSKARKTILNHVQDVEPFIEMNKYLAEKLDKKKTRWFIGHTPDTLHLKWQEECGHKVYSKEWMRYAAKQMNKPEYRKFNPNGVKLKTT